MSNSVRPHRRQPTRLPRPWDSPGKNTGVGCHFLLQCMKVKSESEVVQSGLTLSDPMDCRSGLTLSDPMDCSPPGSSVHGIFQARALEWAAIAFSDRNCRHALFSNGCYCCSSKRFSGGAYKGIQNKAGMWPSEYVMARMGIALNDLSCYITMQSHCLQNVGWTARGLGERTWPPPS